MEMQKLQKENEMWTVVTGTFALLFNLNVLLIY